MSSTAPATTEKFLSNEQADEVTWLEAKLDQVRRVEDSNLDHLARIVKGFADRLPTQDDVDRMDDLVGHIRESVGRRTHIECRIREVCDR